MTPHRILLVDDNPADLELLSAYLEELDVEVRTAPEGRDALAQAATFQPNVIVLDVLMPGLTGWEVCRQLKSDHATRGISVLMVTALGELGDIERAVDAGADDLVTKPVGKQEFLKRVTILLRLHAGR